MTFSNGETIWCDPGHLWTIRDRGKLATALGKLETHEIQKRGLWAGVQASAVRERDFSFQMSKPLLSIRNGICRSTLIFLGFGLGTAAPIFRVLRLLLKIELISKSALSLTRHGGSGLSRDGRRLCGLGRRRSWRAEPLRGLLAASGLLNNKHVPEAYLRSSVEQRQRLLAGLSIRMGTSSLKRGACGL